MSSENVYSLAQEFEEKYNQTTDLVTCIKSAKQPRSRLQEVAQQLEGLDYLLNQMDLEVSLLPKEDQGEISIHKTCRNHFNDLRKKHMEVESRPPASKSTPVVDRGDDELDTANQSLAGHSYEQDVQDLRSKYGVAAGKNEASVPEELLMYRRKKIFEKRLMIGGVVVGALLLIFIVLRVF